MREREPLRVKEGALQALKRAKIPGDTPMYSSVHRIADDGMSDCAEMHADLVSSTGVDRNPAQCHAAEMARSRDPCYRVPRTSGPRRHFLPLDGIATDCGLDSPPGLHHPPDKRDIFLFDFSIVKLPRELLVRRIVLGDDHHSRRSAIQTMDDPGPCFTADTAQILHVVQKRVDQRARRMACSGMDNHSSLFVQHGDVAVLIQDLERERLTRHPGRLDRWHVHGYPIALVHRQVGARFAPRDGDVSRGDQLLNLRTRMTSENGDEELIEPVPVGVRRNGELERHVWAVS
jgi:hypothetical protein